MVNVGTLYTPVPLDSIGMCCKVFSQSYMGVSKNKGTPKWMVYNGKPY